MFPIFRICFPGASPFYSSYRAKLLGSHCWKPFESRLLLEPCVFTRELEVQQRYYSQPQVIPSNQQTQLQQQQEQQTQPHQLQTNSFDREKDKALVLKQQKKKHNWRQKREQDMREILFSEPRQKLSTSQAYQRFRQLQQSQPYVEPIATLQEVIAYSTADAYNFSKLYMDLSKKETNVTITSPENSTVAAGVISRPYKNGEVFYFEGGSMVCWGLSELEIEKLLQELKEYEIHSVETPQTEWINYLYGNSTGMKGDVIYISSEQDKKDTIRHQLAFSYALHQSVKLAELEDKVSEQSGHVKNIQQLLVKPERWWEHRKTTHRLNILMSELLTIRGKINFHSELLETPDLFWDYPELDEFYKKISKNLEINTRISIANKKLEEGHLVLDILKNELNSKNSARMEMIIIALISVEVVLGLIPYYR